LCSSCTEPEPSHRPGVQAPLTEPNQRRQSIAASQYTTGSNLSMTCVPLVVQVCTPARRTHAEAFPKGDATESPPSDALHSRTSIQPALQSNVRHDVHANSLLFLKVQKQPHSGALEHKAGHWRATHSPQSLTNCGVMSFHGVPKALLRCCKGPCNNARDSFSFYV